MRSFRVDGYPTWCSDCLVSNGKNPAVSGDSRQYGVHVRLQSKSIHGLARCYAAKEQHSGSPAWHPPSTTLSWHA
jgi:hypothetical protein